jgi:cell division septation protein DedD
MMIRNLALRGLFLGLLLSMTLPLLAQFRSRMRTANKQYDLHAYNQAVDSYLEAIQYRPNDEMALRRLADSYRKLGDIQEANRYYERAIQNNPDPSAYLEHAHVLKMLGRYDEAKEWYLYFAREYDAEVGNHFAQGVEFAKRQLATTAGYVATPETINTPASEFGPSFAPGNQVIFNSGRIESGNFDGQAANRPFVSEINPDGYLAIPYQLQTGYSGEGFQVGPVGYTADGMQVVFTRNNFVDGTRILPDAGIEVSLMIADVNPSGQWVNVRALPFNGSAFNTGFGTFSPDGQAIYFASDRPEGFGGYDIYVSYRSGNNWSTPENLGPVVNSQGNELTPFFDGEDLYFASDWHHGFGAFDVFRAEQNNGRWTEFFHLGSGINSQYDDMGFVFNDELGIGYVVSNRPGSTGAEDIYHIERAANNITLIITDAASGSPVPNAIVDFVDCGDQAYQAGNDGRYAFQAVAGLNCSLVVRAEGYASATIPLNTADGNTQREVPVALNPLSGAYPGKVVDYNSRLPIRGALVRITNNSTGAVSQAVADANGDYLLSLSPYTTYTFDVSASGYQSLRFDLPVEDGSNRNLLGIISLIAGSGTTTPGGGGTTTPTPGTGASGYAVQLASLSQAPDLSRFANISSLGNVYTVSQNNAYKVRIGVYATRAEAERVAAQVKNSGYSGAFIVTEAGGGGAPTAPPPTTPPTTQPSTGYAPYKVQIGAFRNPAGFDTSRASSLGIVEQVRRDDGITLILIGGLRTEQEARNVQAQARAAGYAGAFAVMEQNGRLVKL